MADINVGSGWWRFIYVKTASVSPPPPPLTYDVTFELDARNIIVNDRGIYLGDGIFGGSNAHPMDDSDGDGIWSVSITIAREVSLETMPFSTVLVMVETGVQRENLTGLSCADPNNFNNRILSAVTADHDPFSLFWFLAMHLVHQLLDTM